MSAPDLVSIVIYTDEYWPYHGLLEREAAGAHEFPAKISRQELAEYHKCMVQFRQWQARLKALMESSHANTRSPPVE